MENTFYTYDSLSKYLLNFKKNNVGALDIHILISMERRYYEGPEFFQFCKSIKENLLNNKNYILFDNTKFKINSIQFDVGDTLNRHNWYYRYCEKYMLNNNLKREEQIPSEIKKNFEKEAYKTSQKQGIEWFKKNLDSINQLIPLKFRIDKSSKLTNNKTSLYKGYKDNPQINYICYNNWLSHPNYKKTSLILKKICNIKNSIIERAFNQEANYFYERISKKFQILFKELFIETSTRYLKDEAIAFMLLRSENPNTLEFYLNGRENSFSQALKGRRAQNNSIIQEYLLGLLKKPYQRNFVSVRLTKS